MRDRRDFEHAVVMAFARALRLFRLRARTALAVRIRIVDPVHRTGEPAREHVAKLALLLGLSQHERGMAQLDAGAGARGIGLDDLEQPPSALRQALQVML